MMLAQIILVLLALYLSLGFLFALAFVGRGVSAVDAAAQRATLGFRLLIFPGAVALWPLLLKRWLKPTPPHERGPHRRAV